MFVVISSRSTHHYFFADFHSYSQAWSHCTNISQSFRSFPWSSIMLLYSLDIFVVVFCVPTFLILGIQGVHCHNFSFGFITKKWGITKEVGQNNVLWSKDISTRVRKWKNMSPNIPNQIPIWELTIPSYPKTLEYIGLGDQTLSKLCFFYTFEKFLKCKYLNWCCIYNLKILKTSCGNLKNSIIKLVIWLIIDWFKHVTRGSNHFVFKSVRYVVGSSFQGLKFCIWNWSNWSYEPPKWWDS